MNYDLNKEIDEYSEELFSDLGPMALPEETKADLYARLEEHLHKALLTVLTPVLHGQEIRRIHEALEQEDYKMLNKILKKYPQYKNQLEGKIEQEFKNLKAVIAEEQKNASRGTV